MPKIPEARHWALRLANEWRSSSTAAGPPPPPPPPPADGFAPEIGFSATGDFVDGANITIFGSGFSAKTHAAPMYLWDSRNQTLQSSPLSRRSFTMPISGDPNKSIDLSFGCNGRASMRGDLMPSGPNSWVPTSTQLGLYPVTLDGGRDYIRIFSRYRRNWSGSDAYAEWALLDNGTRTLAQWNIKNWRWWNSPYQGSNMMVAYGQANSDAGSPRVSEERSAQHQYGIGIYGMRKDVWETDLYMYRHTPTVDGLDGGFDILQSDRAFSTFNFRTRPASWPGDKTLLASIQYQFIYNRSGVQWSDWWDIFYLDDSAHAVVLCDGGWGNPGTKYEIAIPVAWSDTEIVVNLRNGEWGSLVGKTLHVINGIGQRTLIGAFT